MVVAVVVCVMSEQESEIVNQAMRRMELKENELTTEDTETKMSTDGAMLSEASQQQKEGQQDEGPTTKMEENESADGNENEEDTSSTTADSLDDDEEENFQDSVPTTEQADLRLLQATQLKDTGNTHFKANELEQAARCYRQAVSKLKPLIKHVTSADDQVKGCFVALQTNLSMVLFKQRKFKLATDVATRGLQNIPSTASSADSSALSTTSFEASKVKLLFRRAVAHRSLGNLESARDDLRQALQVDAQNIACKRELVAIKKELEQTKENQKKALAKAFSASGNNKKSGSFLYEDKEEERQRKLEEEKKKKEEEQQQLKKRKAQWEDECVKRMANNQPAISFEDWEKEQEEEEKKKQKEEERKRKEERKKRRELARKEKENLKDDNDSDDELTEQELAQMRGYKKTADGRTTSYFTREISEEEKKLLVPAPQRLNNDAPSATGGSQPNIISTSSSSNQLSSSGNGAAPSSRPSAWNAAGTWEEKDTTEWCTAQLRRRLEETHVTTDDFDVDITKIEDVNGHASVALAAGKKRYIFEYDAKLKYEIKNAKEDKSVIAKGVVRLPDICSTSHEEVEVTFDSWKKAPKVEQATQAIALRKQFAEELRTQIQQWVRDFNEQY